MPKGKRYKTYQIESLDYKRTEDEILSAFGATPAEEEEDADGTDTGGDGGSIGGNTAQGDTQNTEQGREEEKGKEIPSDSDKRKEERRLQEREERIQKRKQAQRDALRERMQKKTKLPPSVRQALKRFGRERKQRETNPKLLDFTAQDICKDMQNPEVKEAFIIIVGRILNENPNITRGEVMNTIRQIHDPIEHAKHLCAFGG